MNSKPLNIIIFKAPRRKIKTDECAVKGCKNSASDGGACSGCLDKLSDLIDMDIASHQSKH